MELITTWPVRKAYFVYSEWRATAPAGGIWAAKANIWRIDGSNISLQRKLVVAAQFSIEAELQIVKFCDLFCVYWQFVTSF